MNEKINLQDLVNLFCEKQGLNKKEAQLFVKTMFDLIEEALATEKYVKIKGFGTFKLTEVSSRESVDVNTGERIEIQGHSKVAFTPDATMKDLINKPFAHFESVVLNDGVELEDTPIDNIVEENIVNEVPVIEEIKPEEIMEVAKLACADGDTLGNMPFEVTPEDVYAAILGADALGRYSLGE